MNEGKVLVEAKKPILSREASANYEHHQAMWDIHDNFEKHGGSPTIIGIVNVMRALRYKVQFPDGLIDYFKLETFDKFCEMKAVSEESKNDLVVNLTINIDSKDDIEKYIKEMERRFSLLGNNIGEALKKAVKL